MSYKETLSIILLLSVLTIGVYAQYAGVAKKANDIRSYMNSSFVNSKMQIGNVRNMQENSLWDGKLLNRAQTNQVNSSYNSFVANYRNTLI
jgi:hypothetical protein